MLLILGSFHFHTNFRFSLSISRGGGPVSVVLNLQMYKHSRLLNLGLLYTDVLTGLGTSDQT